METPKSNPLSSRSLGVYVGRTILSRKQHVTETIDLQNPIKDWKKREPPMSAAELQRVDARSKPNVRLVPLWHPNEHSTSDIGIISINVQKKSASTDSKRDEGGVAKMITQNAAKLLMEWTPISIRIITARVYTRYRIVAMIQVYAPIMKRKKKRKNSFTKRYKKH